MGLVQNLGSVEWVERYVTEALTEDLGERGDITSWSTVPENLFGRAELIAKADGIVAGADWAVVCGELTSPAAKWSFKIEDGTPVKKGDVIAVVEGPMRGILISERTALNGYGRLSGIATFAAKAMEMTKGTKAKVIDTRKTTPGWRMAEKYAVRMGGADNHRIGLFDEILIKENHIEAAGGVAEAVKAAKDWRSEQKERARTPIEIEVEDMESLATAIEFGPDRILLDNFTPEEIRKAVEFTNGRCILEASGGITMATLADYAATGVDRISLGAMTHSIIPLDISLLVRETYLKS